AYYCVYHGTQAAGVASGHPRPTSHPKTQQLFASLWTRRGLAIAPWSLAATGEGFVNVPSGVSVDRGIRPIHTFDPDNSWALACKALETTRATMVADALKGARGEKRKRRKQAWEREETSRIRSGLRPRKSPRWPNPKLNEEERQHCAEGVRPA